MVLAGITKSSIFFGIYSLYTLAMILPATAMACADNTSLFPTTHAKKIQ